MEKPEVFVIGELKKHPNADTLSICYFYGYPSIIRTNDFKTGDKAVFIPHDWICPPTPQFEFLGQDRHIKSRKLRGIFSTGLIIPANPEWPVGYNPSEELGLTQYESKLFGDDGSNSGFHYGHFAPSYTDIPTFKRYGHKLIDNEYVYIMEKIHGENARFLFAGDELFVGSNEQWIKSQSNNAFWEIAIKEKLSEKLSTVKNMCFYGEIFGRIKPLKYGMERELSLNIFDIFSVKEGYLNFDLTTKICLSLDLNLVPVIYKGEYKRELVIELSEGNSYYGHNIKEGVVIRPTNERWDDEVGRVILKNHGEGFLTMRKK